MARSYQILTMALMGALATPALAQNGNGMGNGMGGGGGGGANGGIYVVKLDDGVSKRQNVTFLPNGMVRAQRNGGAGNEQAVMSVVGQTVMVAYASNNVANLKGPSAIKCVALQMQPNGPPTIVGRAQLTNSNSDRLGHPAIAQADNAGHFVIAYGANNVQGNGNTQTYALVVDSACKDLTATPGAANPEEQHIRISQDRNNNIAAPRLVWDGKKIVGGIYKNGDAEYGFLLDIVPTAGNGLAPKLLSDNQRLTPSNIGRPAIHVLSGTRALYAAPRGNQRPSEEGDELRLLNTDVAALVTKNGRTEMPQLWSKIVVQATKDPNNVGGVDGLPGPLGGKGIYPASPSLAATDKPNEVYLTTFISNGSGRNRNKKGSSTDYMARLQISDTGVTTVADATGVALESSHVVACSGMIGVTGAEQHHLAVAGTPIAGFGAGSLSFVNFDPAKVQAAMNPTAAPSLGTQSAAAFSLTFAAAVSPSNADGGYLSNMLGRNPGTQGRNHNNCLGDIPNVGYAVAGGFMPKVKTFFLMPWNGRVNIADGKTPVPQVQALDGRMLPEDRNALFLSMVAAVRDADAPAPPAAAPPGAVAGMPGGTTTNPGAPGSMTAGSETPGTTGHFAGGCSVGGNSQTGGWTSLALLMVACLWLARRRAF